MRRIMNKKSLSLGIGFTSNCNMKCSFCYSKNNRNNSSECSYTTWTSFFEKNGDFIKNINYGTGENPTHDDWFLLITQIREHHPHIKQALTTNGSLYNIIKSDNLKNRAVIDSIDEIDISLDWGEKDKHNEYRENIYAFDWALETLDYCKNNNIKATIVTLGTDETLVSENMKKIFMLAEMYNTYVRINLYRPVDKLNQIKPASLEKVINIFDWIYKNHNILSISDSLFSSIFSDSFSSKDPSGITSFRITSDGNIYPSTYLLYKDFLIGNIFDFDFKNITTHNVIKLFTMPIIPKTCIECSLVDRCRGGVLDRRYIWFKDFLESDPYCPRRYGVNENIRNYRIDSAGFSSIHDEYLPTLFFKF